MLCTVHYFPIASFIILSFTVIITYMICIWNGHCNPAHYPYISDSGTHSPESCLFGLFLNCASWLVGLTIAVRYKNVQQLCKDNLEINPTRVFALNRWSLMIGLVSTAGLSVVANFQEIQLFTVHMIGAFTVFGFGLTYCILQTWLSYHMHPIVKEGLTVARIRLVLTAILSITFITTSVSGIVAYSYFHGTEFFNWKPDDGGFWWHAGSSISEWISFLCLDFYILSLSHELKFMTIGSPRVYLVQSPQVLNSESDEYGVVNVVVNSDNRATTSRSSRRQHKRQAEETNRD